MRTGPVSGFVTLLAALPAESGEIRLGIEKLFLELGGPEDGPMNGLRVYAERFGLAEGPHDGPSAAAEGLIAGSRIGSRAHAATGSIASGGAFASAERAVIQFGGPDFPDRRDYELGNQADRGDELHLRGRVWGIQLAELLSERLFPGLSADPELQGELSGDLGVTGTVRDQSVQFTAAMGLNLDGRPALRISASFSMEPGDPFVHRIRGVIAVDGFETDDPPAAEMARAQKLASMLSERLRPMGQISVFASALESAARQYAELGMGSETGLQLTIPADLPDGQGRSSLDRAAQLAASLGLLPQDSET